MTKEITLIALLTIAALACSEQRQAIETPAPGTETAAAPAEAAAFARPGNPMPAYSARLLDGATFDIEQERGNVLLINLWATWCGPCRYEIPELEKLHSDHGAKRFKVVGVSVDEGGDQVVRDFVNEQKMTYPVVLDPEGRLATMFETTVLPTSVIVDRNGQVIWKHIGVVTATDAEMLRILERALQS